MTEELYRIYMDEIITGDGGYSPRQPLEGGWFGPPGFPVGMNRQIYCRVPDKDRAWTYTRANCQRAIDDMRAYGYPCHADPPFTVTRAY